MIRPDLQWPANSLQEEMQFSFGVLRRFRGVRIAISVFDDFGRNTACYCHRGNTLCYDRTSSHNCACSWL
jgi:hypothetical protein